jgi:hypothetical protein
VHIPDASLCRSDVRARSAAERRVAGLHDGCAGTGRRRVGSTRAGTPLHTPRHKKYCRDRIARRCSPTRRSPGSYTAGSSLPALAPHAPTGLDSAVLRGDKCLAGGCPTGIAPLEARGFLIGFPGLLCLGVASSLSGNGSARREREIQQKKTQSFCLRRRQTALRLRHRRRQQTEDDHQWGTGGQTAPFPRITRI